RRRVGEAEEIEPQGAGVDDGRDDRAAERPRRAHLPANHEGRERPGGGGHGETLDAERRRQPARPPHEERVADEEPGHGQDREARHAPHDYTSAPKGVARPRRSDYVVGHTPRKCSMAHDAVLNVTPIGFPWKGFDPFLFIAHHVDDYPAGDERM